MKAFFALVLLALVAMAAADHHEGHATQPETSSDPQPAEHTAEEVKDTKDLKSAEAVYLASPYAYTAYGAGHPYAYSAQPYAYAAYPAYTYYG